MNPETHIVYCRTDERFICLAQNKSAAQAVYSALANTTVRDEQYEIEPLDHYLTSRGYPADMIGELMQNERDQPISAAGMIDKANRILRRAEFGQYTDRDQKIVSHLFEAARILSTL